MKKFITLALALVFLGGCSAGSGSQNTPTVDSTTPTVTTPAAESASVSIQNFAFSPATLTVKKGAMVTWTNNDSMSHTVTSAGNFDSGILETGKSFSQTFETAGTFDYICTIHPSMAGKIIVE